jgi:transposase
VEQWAEVRRLHFVRGLSIREIHRRTGLHRDTIRRALVGDTPPRYRRAPTGSKLDPFKDEIHRLLREDPKLPGVRVRELLAPLGCTASKTVVDDYLRGVRPLFAPPARTFQRTVYRPGEIVQFDVWLPRARVPVGHGQTRRGWVVIACLGYSRAGAGVLVFSTQAEDLLAGIAGCLERLGGLPRTLVWDRQTGIHGHAGRRATRSPRSAGSSKWVGGSASPPTRKPRAPSSGCRATPRRTSSPAARSPTSSTSRTSSTPGLNASTPAGTRRCAIVRSIGCAASWRRWSRCQLRCPTPRGAGP